MIVEKINVLLLFFFQFQATASRLSNGHINFAKARNLAQKLKEFAIWKDVESPYAKTPVVAEFLQNSPIWSEKGMQTRIEGLIKGVLELHSIFDFRHGIAAVDN